MREKCPACFKTIEINMDEMEEGDFTVCEECGEDLIAEVKGGQLKLVTNTEKKYEEIENLDESFDSEFEE